MRAWEVGDLGEAEPSSTFCRHPENPHEENK